MFATISADIVSSTSLTEKDLIRLNTSIKACLSKLEDKYDGLWGRLVRGDTIECVTPHVRDALRIALCIKTLVKSFVPSEGSNDKFSQYAVRMAIAVGDMRIVNRDLDILDGEAIYLSGRAVSGMTRETFLISRNFNGYQDLQIMMSLIDFTINKAKPRQCQTLYYKLLGCSQYEISVSMGISPSAVSQNLKSVGWDVIEPAVKYFESFSFNPRHFKVV